MKLSLLEGFDRQVRDFVTAHAPFAHCEFQEGDRGFAIVDGGNRLVGGVVFSEWKPSFASVEVSAVMVHSFSLSPQIVMRLGHYAFGQLECWRLWARTSVKNHRARKLLRHIGFTAEGVENSFYGPGRHAEMHRMLRPDWENIYGPVEAKAAA